MINFYKNRIYPKSWQNRIFISVFLLLIFTQAICPQTQPRPTKSRVIGQELKKLVNEDKAPGMIGAIISSEGGIAIGSAGVRKAGTDIPFTAEDHVHLGSCTKAMTATMLATLVGEGKLAWGMKLIDAIPKLKKSIHPDYHKITLWQLLTHRAGIVKNPADWGSFEQLEIKERRLCIIKENLRTSRRLKSGEFHYSNFGYMIAACMAEKKTGLSWETLMKKRLFEPLGMNSAGFGSPGTADKIDQPWGHERWGSDWNPSYPDNPEALGPAGRIHCSIKDWAKFLRIQLTGKTPILKDTYLKKLITPVGYYAGGWGVAKQPWARGIILSHSGSNGIWYTSVIVAPKLNRAFIVATNSRDFGSTGSMCNKMTAKLIRMELPANNK